MTKVPLSREEIELLVTALEHLSEDLDDFVSTYEAVGRRRLPRELVDRQVLCGRTLLKLHGILAAPPMELRLPLRPDPVEMPARSRVPHVGPSGPKRARPPVILMSLGWIFLWSVALVAVLLVALHG